MIPDPTQIAEGAALVNTGFELYPILGLVLAIVVVLWAGFYVMRKVKGLFGR